MMAGLNYGCFDSSIVADGLIWAGFSVSNSKFKHDFAENLGITHTV
jgi:hypothetical protein